MTTIYAFVIGLIVGWLGEWALDWFYWRRKTRQAETRSSDLEAQLVQMQNDHANELAALRADLAEREQEIDAMGIELAGLPGGIEGTPTAAAQPSRESSADLWSYETGAAVDSWLEDAGEETQQAEVQAEAEALEAPAFPAPVEEETQEEEAAEWLPDVGEETQQAEVPEEEVAQEATPSPAATEDEPEWLPAFLEEEELTEEPAPVSQVEEAEPVVVEAASVEEVSETIAEEEEAQPAVVETSAAEEVVEAPVEDEAELQPSPDDELAKFRKDIGTVEGVDPAYGETLRAAGIPNPLLLLQQGASAKGRAQIAEKTGIRPDLILKWVNHVDLYRIRGLAPENVKLLELSGVDTVVELAMRNPASLHEKLVAINEDSGLVQQVPELAQVVDWIEQAKSLPRAVTY